MNLHPKDPNLAQLREAVLKLIPLLDQVVFVGGCIVGLLITDSAAAPIRATLDVDVIVESSSYADFAVLEGRLRKLGFSQPVNEPAPVCRWISGNLVVDFLPTDPAIMGFRNRWYGAAMKQAQTFRVAEHDIRCITAPYFVATKLEAFRARGKHDYRMSHDLEDIIGIIDGRPELLQELRDCPDDLRRYLSEQCRTLLADPAFRDAMPGHLLPDKASQQRIAVVLNRMQQIVAQG